MSENADTPQDTQATVEQDTSSVSTSTSAQENQPQTTMPDGFEMSTTDSGHSLLQTFWAISQLLALSYKIDGMDEAVWLGDLMKMGQQAWAQAPDDMEDLL